MKLLRYGEMGHERPGLRDAEGRVRDLSAQVTDFGGPTVTLDALDRIRAIDPEDLPVVEAPGRIASPLAWVPNLLCIGLNYTTHAAETGAEPPAEPILFSKHTSALAGPDDAVPLPGEAEKGDWEVELAVIIGAPCRRVSEDRALEHVAGYATLNDLSERAFQIERGGQWIKGKSLPGFAPLGPWLVTADEVADPQSLGLWLSLNGERVQESTTADMIFGVAEIIAYASRFMTLMPGDVIATGTPHGVGMGMKPQRFLKPGDVMELEVEGLGRQRQEVVAD